MAQPAICETRNGRNGGKQQRKAAHVAPSWHVAASSKAAASESGNGIEARNQQLKSISGVS